MVNPQRGESELHFQTDLFCPQNGKIPKYKGDSGPQAEALPGEAGSLGGGGRSYPAIPTGTLVRLPRCNGNLRLERPELKTERDLGSGPAQGIAGTQRLG